MNLKPLLANMRMLIVPGPIGYFGPESEASDSLIASI